MVPLLSVSFSRGGYIAPQLRKEIAANNWEVAASNAYPQILTIDEELTFRPPTTADFTPAEAIALSLTGLATEMKALLNAWQGGRPFSRTLPVKTHQGKIEVTRRVPKEKGVRPQLFSF